MKIPHWFLCFGIALSTVLAGSPAQAQAVNYQNYNAIIFNDLKTSSDIEGRTFVGHDFTGTNSANLGIHLSNSVPSNDRTFVVGNSIFAGNPINLQRGSLYIDGSTNGRGFNFNGGGSVVADHTIDATTAAIRTSSIFQSQSMQAMAADSTVILPSGSPGPTKFMGTGGADGVAVFNVSAADIFSNPNGQQFELYADSFTSNFVINVSGTSVDWTNGNMVGLFTDNYWQDHTIWNFYEATSINLGSHNFNGAILAPYATITTSANIDGLVVANNLTTTAEVHLPNNGNAYDGYTATPVPEPGSASLILVVGGLMLLARNRRLLV